MIEPVSALILMLILLGIGAGAERMAAAPIPAERYAAAFWLVSGWAAFSILGAAAAFLDVAFPPILIIAGVAGGLGLILCAGRGRRPAIGYAALALALVLPLLWFVARTPATIFDEFGQWLPNARFLYEHGHFPTASEPNALSAKPGYPPAIPMAIAAGSEIAGHFGETIGKLLVVALAAGFGLVLADRLAPRLGPALSLVAGVALATVLNPFFDPRVVLTNYADAPTGFVLALTVFAVWRARERADAVWLWRAGAGAALLALLRETNLVLIAGLCLGLAIVALRVGSARAWRALIAALASAAIPFLAWRIYLRLAEIPPAMVIRPISLWDWRAPVTVLRSLLLDRLFGNPLLGGAAALALIVAAVASWRMARRSSGEVGALLVLTISTCAVWIGFLTFSYIAVFAAAEVARAASAWRYVGQLGPTLLLLLAAAIGRASASPVIGGAWRRVAPYGGALILVAAQLATWRYWRIDCRYGDVMSVRRIADRIAASGAVGDSPLTVVNGVEAPAYAVQLDYDLRRPTGRSHGVGAFGDATGDGLILDLGAVDRATASTTGSSPSVTLFRREGPALIPVLTVPALPIGRSCRAF